MPAYCHRKRKDNGLKLINYPFQYIHNDNVCTVIRTKGDYDNTFHEIVVFIHELYKTALR